MPRFTDQWVIDRVLFDYVSGGSCACCGVSFAQFLPNGTADLIGAVSDLDTDQATKEINALEHHPWPRELRDQVWADRVKLRQKLKQSMKMYREFYQEEGEGFEQWCRDNPLLLKKCLQIPRSEIATIVTSRYDIHSAFGVVLSTVVEQVACFGLTKYPTDARGDTGEVDFEKDLHFSRMSGFTLNVFWRGWSNRERRSAATLVQTHEKSRWSEAARKRQVL